MLFNSYIFILVFLPFTLLAHRLNLRYAPSLAPASLLISSLIFYGYWSLTHTAWLILSILVNHLVSRAMVHSQQAKALAIAAIGFNLGLLGYFKYYGFFSNEILSHIVSVDPVAIILPIGISFFTFQQIAYIVDVYKGKAQPGDLLQYALFVTFFPQLIAGPIVHHAEILPQLTAKREDRIRDLQIGLAFFIIGLSKKLIMADGLSPIVGEIFSLAEQDAVGFVTA